MSLTKKQASEFGVPYPAGGVPSVDNLINHCAVLSGNAQNTCYENLDATMMTKVAAWAPYIWGRSVVITAPTVKRYVQDPWSGLMSIRQAKVDNGLTLAAKYRQTSAGAPANSAARGPR